MNSLLSFVLTPPSTGAIQIGLPVLRIGIGVLMVMHGFPKITGGYAVWYQLGQAVSYFGVRFLFGFWGFLAACIEFFGLGTRITSVFLCSLMVVALRYHLVKGDSLVVYSHALGLLSFFAGLLSLRRGTFSLDYFLTR